MVFLSICISVLNGDSMMVTPVRIRLRDVKVFQLSDLGWQFEQLKYYTFWLKYWMLSPVQLDKFIDYSLAYLLCKQFIL